ncbi:AAA family ATPase [Paenibacillus chitinolyticus]|uniref:AAA family ATPase n=1 Tax=Paenibacillus chitinolyticus TaxID=79263 RepID=UPI0036469FF9
MKFYVINYSKVPSIPPEVTEYPCIVLMSDNWNDFGFETYFYFYYVKHSKYNPELIGAYKILDKKNPRTRYTIEKAFKKLTKNYCSLGQSLEFYEKAKKFGLTKKDFACLNDASFDKDIYDSFREEEGFRESLLRWSEATKALREANEIFGGIIENRKSKKFTFNYKIPNATSPHIVNLNFDKSNLPFRINCFVGKNATGKTKVLSQLASQLSGAVQKENNSFHPERPSFSKVIAISYSAFDELYKPFEDNKRNLESEETRMEETVFFSYVYCGLRTKKGVLSLEDVENNFFDAYDVVRKKNREEQWTRIMSNVLEEESITILKDMRENHNSHSLNSLFSSGQNILISIMTEVIANIELDSILLFDEPEIHLHPNAIANFMRMCYEILEEFESFAVISTHSPLIIQEIPSRYVHLFSRISNTPLVETLYNECFGENISTITNDVFEVREHESNYKNWFKKMSVNNSKEEIIDLFENDLSFNALTYLNTLFHNKSKEEEY